MALQEASTWSTVVMLTLTVDPARVNGDAYLTLAGAWDRLSRRLRAKYDGLRYMAFLQVQPRTGMPHLHVLVDRWLSATFVHVEWELTGVVRRGMGVDLKELPSDRAVSYAARYLGKEMHRVQLPPGQRRVWASRGIQFGLSHQGRRRVEKTFETEEELWAEARKIVRQAKSLHTDTVQGVHRVADDRYQERSSNPVVVSEVPGCG